MQNLAGWRWYDLYLIQPALFGWKAYYKFSNSPGLPTPVPRVYTGWPISRWHLDSCLEGLDLSWSCPNPKPSTSSDSKSHPLDWNSHIKRRLVSSHLGQSHLTWSYRPKSQLAWSHMAESFWAYNQHWCYIVLLVTSTLPVDSLSGGVPLVVSTSFWDKVCQYTVKKCCRPVFELGNQLVFFRPTQPSFS